MSNLDIEKALEELPEKVSQALENWRIATLEREKTEALLYISIKGKNPDKTIGEIKSALNASVSRYDAVLAEIKAESEYTFLYEKLLSAKKRASLRIAF